jgi:hypothetical protein
VTNPSIKSARLALLERLTEIIEQRLVEIAPDGLTPTEVASALGVAYSTVRNRLKELEDLGRVHRTRHTVTGKTSIYYMWHAGPKPEGEPAPEDLPEFIPGATPKQPTVRVYPPINRRDDLVAALFGAARVGTA